MSSGDPESDLERFKAQQNAVIAKSLESTRNMVKLVKESQAVGLSAMSRLGQPGERMSGGEGRLDIQLEWKNGAMLVLCFVEREKRSMMLIILNETSKDSTILKKKTTRLK